VLVAITAIAVQAIPHNVEVRAAAGPRDRQPAAAAVAPSSQARASSDFADSVGVCMHLGRVRTHYVQRFAEIEKLLIASGIRHVRTDPVTAPEAVANVRKLAAQGVQFDFIIHPDGERLTAAQLLENVRRNFADCTVFIEGLNEPDSRPEQARQWMRQIQQICKADDVLKGIPILGSALAHPHDAAARIGDCSTLVDAGNIHAYPGGRAPEVTLPLYIGYVQPQYPHVKYAITETGYHSALNNPANKHKPASREAEAIYMPRLYLEHFRAGILRSYKYQFADDRTDDEATKRHQPVQEANFGYVDYQLQAKPAYHAVKNLLAILHDEKTKAFQPQSLAYSLEGAKDQLRSLLLQKADGDFYLAVWRAVSVWDENSRRDMPVQSVPVGIRLPGTAKAVRVYRPTHSAEPVKTDTNAARLVLDLGADAVIIQIEQFVP
jgi:hypothetical protein